MYALRDTRASSLHGPDRRRLVLALVCSVFAHAWFAHLGGGGSVSRDNPAPAQSLAVTLDVLPTVVPSDVALAERAIPASGDAARARRAPRSRKEYAPRAPSSETTPVIQESSNGVADSTYYGARELDVYPSLAAPLSLKALRVSEGAPARVELLLLISDTGHVEEVSVVSANAVGTFIEDARGVFLAARFVPGQRDGRRVKSRLLVEVAVGGEH